MRKTGIERIRHGRIAARVEEVKQRATLQEAERPETESFGEQEPEARGKKRTRKENARLLGWSEQSGISRTPLSIPSGFE
jgi:hypothetical protein